MERGNGVLEIQAAGNGQDDAEQHFAQKLDFDKLVVAVGPHCTPIIPNLPGKDNFKGQILHSVASKDPSPFTGARVMVVGIGDTAADTATALVSHASSVFLAHRYGAAVLPRILKDGTSLDHRASYRAFGIKDALDVYAPALSRKFVDNWTGSLIKSEWGGYDPQWRLTPIPNFVHQVPTVSDALIPALRDGKIKSVAAPKHIVRPNAVELEDGETVDVDVDVIIWCTGYHPNFSFFGEHDPTAFPAIETCHSDFLANFKKGSNKHDNSTKAPAFHATPILHQNIFSLTHPENLAFIGLASVSFPAFLTSDLASMAVAQLWSSSPSSPPSSPTLSPSKEMYAWLHHHLQWPDSIRASSPTGRFPPFSVQNGPWLTWGQDIVGAKIDEHLSFFSLQAWSFWLQDRAFCKLLANGIYSPHFYRLFDSHGRRRSWGGVRAAIETVNADVKKRLDAKKRAGAVTGNECSVAARVMPVDAVVAA